MNSRYLTALKLMVANLQNIDYYAAKSEFHSDYYLRHTSRRLEHLASLRLPVSGTSVLEVGAGIGDHTSYYLDRGCTVTTTEARESNIKCLRARYPDCQVVQLDMEKPVTLKAAPFNLIHCYGLLYHLSNPEIALNYMSQNTNGILILETCVSYGENNEINQIAENQAVASQAFSGTGCRPTRTWVFNALTNLFEFVYITKTQPNHPEFPLDWGLSSPPYNTLTRAVFIASREKLDLDSLTSSLLMRQERHE